MTRPWKPGNESDLRAARPQPRPDLISQIVGRVEATRVPFRRGRLRLVLASALTTGALVAFALAGGFSYTASAASAAAHATGIAKANNAGGNGNGAKGNASSNAKASAAHHRAECERTEHAGW